MSGTFVYLPPEGGSVYWQDAVATVGALPAAGANIGESRLVLSNGQIYYWNGTTWVSSDPTGPVQGVANTNSIDLTLTSSIVTADLNLSAAAADAGFLKSTYSIKNDGLFIETPFASGSQTGVLQASDWTTFNSKEPAIAAGTTSQYWRGDKSFQTLNVAALVADSGSAASTGSIGEIITASVTSATTTGIGATGVYGNVASIALTAGDWVITGVAGFSENGAVLTTSLSCGFSSTSNGSGLGALDAAVYNGLVSSTSDLVAPVPTLNLTLAAPTTYYLNTRFFYTSGTPKHYGRIEARRIR